MFSSNTSSAEGGYQISRSLRFNSADSAYLNRTPASAGNRRTWTWSAWVKRGAFGAAQELFSAVGLLNDSELFGLGLNANDKISVGIQTVNVLVTTAVYRDPSAWYHIVFALDTPQATASNRAKLYVNGVQVTTFDTTNYPSQNADLGVNFTSVHGLGFLNLSGFFRYLNGYMTEVNFIDGQALTPSSFGETNAQTGVWQPKAYSGSYGTNGFYLNFSDNSNTTAATLGKDYSGNGNNWTPNNFSVSAGAGNDSLVDSPTAYGTDTGAGGTVRGNYATLNPLDYLGTLANGNLDISGVFQGVATISPRSGKWYFEITLGSIVANSYIGLYSKGSVLVSYCVYGINGFPFQDSGFGSPSSTLSGTGSIGDIIGFALDVDNASFTLYKNGVSLGSVTNITFPSDWFVGASVNASVSTAWNFNFGQRPWAYTAPSGFKALCTQNLPTPTIGATSTTQAGKYFNPVLYTGTGSTQAIAGVGFQPDLVWLKNRGSTGDHGLFDVVRGTTNRLVSNSTIAENTISGVTAFNADGFSLGADYNGSGNTFVAWNWKANGAGSSNTAGSITSTVSANTTSGFSVVTWTGNGIAASIGHGIGAAPKMVITKNRDNTWNWFTYHQDAGASYYLELNTTAGRNLDTAVWQNTAPTSSVFTIGSGINANGAKFVAYCFAEVAGYSRFGSYTGNGSADGPFVFTGMRPAFVMLKNTTTAGNAWHMIDTARGTYNVYGPSLDANASSAEITYTICDLLSNGFKLRDTNQAWNKSGDVYIFMAFASNPFKFALAR